MRPFWNWMGIIALVALGSVLIRNPKIISNFFTGYTGLIGTAVGK